MVVFQRASMRLDQMAGLLCLLTCSVQEGARRKGAGTRKQCCLQTQNGLCGLLGAVLGLTSPRTCGSPKFSSPALAPSSGLVHSYCCCMQAGGGGC